MIITGSSEDGSDARIARGVYMNPENPNEWSSEPYLPQRKEARQYESLIKHINGKRSVIDELNLVKKKQSKLSKSMRDYVVTLCKTSHQI